MYRNDVGIDEQAYMSEEESDKFYNSIVEKELEYYKSKLSEVITNNLVIWLKYSRAEHDLNTAIKMAQEYMLGTKDILDIKHNVKKSLKSKYAITIIQEDPLILESEIPFEKIVIESDSYEK